MGNGHIHPAIFIEVEDGYSPGGRQVAVAIERDAFECTFALVFEDRRRSVLAGHYKIHCPVIVDVGEDGGCSSAGTGQARRPGPFAECGVAIVPPQNVWPHAGAGSRSCDEEVEIAVMIKIHEGQPGRMIRRVNANSRSSISEFAMPQVVEDRDTIFKHYGKIRQTIIVIVADGTRDSLPLE